MRKRKDTGYLSYKNVERHLADTVSNESPTRKDITMKLLCIFAAFVAITLGEEPKNSEPVIDDSEAVATVELLKTSPELLQTAASSYNYPQKQNTPNKWATTKNSEPYYAPQNNYVPYNNYPQNNYVPPQNNYVPPQNNYVPPQNNYVPPQNNYVPPQNNYVPPQNNYFSPQNNYVPPQNNYVPPQNNYVPPQKPQNDVVPPQNNYVPPQNDYYIPPQNNYKPPSNDYVPPNNNWKPPQHHHPTVPPTTTPSGIIKNEISYGDNGSYKFEYEVADGTHAAEEGYLINPNTEHESQVKKGWYSYPGPDGKVYTVTYWADHTGFHATGDHLPTPPPIPPAIQASIEENAKEEAAKAEAEKNKPQNPIYTGHTEKPYYPHPTNPPQQTYYPPQQTYYPPQQTYYPQNQGSYGK